MKKQKRAVGIPETKRILPKTPNRAYTEMKNEENVVQGNESETKISKR